MRVLVIVWVMTVGGSAFAQNSDPTAADAPGTGLPPPPAPPMVLPTAVRPHPFAMTGDGWEFHHGVTAEANLGLAYAHTFDDQFGDAFADRLGGGFGLGVGMFVGRRLAVSLRLVNVDYVSTAGSALAQAFIGPSAQLWLDPHIWIGAGIGLAGIVQLSGCDSSSQACSDSGIGFDARVGYSVGGTAHTINVSVEAIPAYYGSSSLCTYSEPTGALGVELLFGYQYL
jgi:hypothetical protein